MKRVIGTAAVLLGVLSVLIGCGSAAAPPSKDGSSSSTSQARRAATPTVSHPIDVDQYRLNPCPLVPGNTLHSLKLGHSKTRPGQYSGDKQSKACRWTGPKREMDTLDVSLTGVGIKGQYEKQKVYPTGLRPTSVAGYPAVYDVSNSDRKRGDNGMMIGVNSHESVGISTHSDHNPAHAKEMVDKAAVGIVRNIRSKGK